MAAFTENEVDKTLDWEILLYGGISMYRNRKYLNDDLQWLRLRGYRVYRIDCKAWTSEAMMLESFGEVLSFPAYYGRNFNALRDCLWDVEVPNDSGLAIILDSYDLYARNAGLALKNLETRAAETVLDILAECSRYFLLRGRRFITLVQSDDPLMAFEGLAGVSTHWNRREWLNKDRGL
ncbi:barstar family protein [Tunturiibacter gelidoferens]|uniref:RNAse (Barnase) inhibitor barstar n=1 Tax=Tunturiibacter lichenicola TaxID=2051959 RepID=A0A7Y9NKU7_9BACT|nr:barstar family protein [Edaphobacter lichenicola]NYF51246.1 RNAse (barnase) inhibitor barstar [Edaphobacter lichenicola]